MDVAVRCVVAGDFELRIESERSIDTTMPLAALYVEGGSSDMEDDLETWTPCRYSSIPTTTENDCTKSRPLLWCTIG